MSETASDKDVVLTGKNRSYREIAVEAPEGSIPGVLPTPEGMVAWRNLKNGFAVVACHYTADEEKRNDEWYTEACRNLREDQIERELEINFDSKSGTKAFPYLEHNGSVFRIDPLEIPANWKIIIGLDYGARNATAALWCAIDEYRRFWVFDEFYCPMNQYEEKGGLPGFARYLKEHPYYPRVKHIVADPSIFNRGQNVIVTKENSREDHGTLMSIAELLQKQGIWKLQRANNDRAAGMARIQQMFAWRGDPKITNPFLFVGRKCPKLWWELQNLVYKLDSKQTKNADEDIVKRNDHAFDALKYALLSQDAPAAVPLQDPRAVATSLKVIEDEIDEAYNLANRAGFESCFKDYDDDSWNDAENF